MDRNKEVKTSLKPVATIVQKSAKAISTKLQPDQQQMPSISRGSLSATDSNLPKRPTGPSRLNPIPLPASRPPSGRPVILNKAPAEILAQKPAIIGEK